MAEGSRKLASPRRIAVAAAAVVALALGGVALAQPGHGHHRGGFGGGDMLAGLIAHAKSQLNLNTSQQGQFDSAVAQSKAAMESGRNNRQRVKDALNAELAKAEPDFAAVAAIADDVRAQNQALHKQIRDQWLSLYNTFSPDQKAVVKQMVEKRMARMERFRERMHERMHERMMQRQGNG
jgi:Spy/CpxP family protein refolding chaperone